MRNRVLIAAAFLLLGCCAPACRKSPPPSTSAEMPPGLPTASPEVTNEIDGRVHAEWDAITRKDKQALGALLEENYIAVEADREGERFKWKVLSELDRSSVTQTTLSFLKVTPLGPDAVFARYEVFMRFPPGSTQPYLKVMVGEIWTRDGGQWKALHYQETPVK